MRKVALTLFIAAPAAFGLNITFDYSHDDNNFSARPEVRNAKRSKQPGNT